MPDTASINQLPLRTTGSTRWPRKWSTIGGRGATSSSTTMIPTVDSDSTENPVQTHNNNHRHSTSLLRKSSTISRTNDKSNPSNENLDPTLKKSRSLMNVLRSKFNSPAVLRRFRSKSRESTKQAVTEVANGHTPNEQSEVKQSNDEQISTRKSRKRDPSPIKRFTNCISQLTRHQRAKSTDRPKQSPSKSIINDLQNEKRKSPSPSPVNNQDKVDRINACYDEIRAKYFTDNDTKKRNALNDDTNNRSLSTISVNGSLLSNDFLSNTQRVPIPIISDDPLLQARKQSNIKLNCLLSGYTLTRSFANHEKLFGQNDLFKSNHFYDVEKRRYDWNYTNHNNRLFSSMRTKPISKSIDNFRHTHTHDNQVSAVLEKANIVNNNTLVQKEKHEDVSRILPNDNELVICENSDDLIDSEQNILHHSPNIDVTSTSPINVTTFMPTSSNLSDKINDSSNEHRAEEIDEEFEQNFLRAVNRALGVVNKDQSNLTQTVYDETNEKDESHLNLIQMTERALSSLNTTTLFMNGDQSNVLSDNSTESTSVELVASPNELLTAKNTLEIVNENGTETSNDEDIMSVIEDLLRKTEDILFEETKNGRTFLAKLDDEEKIIKLRADGYNKLLQTDDSRLTEDVRTDINAVIGEVNLLLKGKLKQFRGLCERNVNKSPGGEPIPLDTDLEGFWDITFPLIDKVKEKFSKLDVRKTKQWAIIEEYDPNDVNNRPRIIDDRLKQLQPQQNKSKIPVTKPANDHLKKLIQEKRKAAANTANHDIEIFVAQK